MAKTKKQADKPSKGAAPAGKAEPARREDAERPPESAEDFSHVLRRLISGRAGRGDGAGRRA